jgi:hypothetical protein
MEVSMKLKSLIIAGILTLFTSSAFAQWFPGQVQVSVLPGQVAFQVFNPHFQPIVCNGQVFGQTMYGQIFSSGFFQQLLPAGAFRYAYVNAIPFAPFSHGWANIQCYFVGGWF